MSADAITVNSVWQYGPQYPRDGRFVVVGQNVHGLWRCKEATRLAEERFYTSQQILEIAALTKIQPGQLWLNGHQEERRVTRPLVPYVSIYGFSDPSGGARWESRAPDGTIQDASENSMLSVWTLVILPPGVTGKDRCLLCGQPCRTIFNFVECISPSCPNHRKP